MKFLIQNDILGSTIKGKPITWIQAGMYNVVRLFDEKRVMIDVTPIRGSRAITLVHLNRGQLIRDDSETS